MKNNDGWFILSQEHFTGYVGTTLNITLTNNFETNGAPYLFAPRLDSLFVTWRSLWVEVCADQGSSWFPVWLRPTRRKVIRTRASLVLRSCSVRRLVVSFFSPLHWFRSTHYRCFKKWQLLTKLLLSLLARRLSLYARYLRLLVPIYISWAWLALPPHVLSKQRLWVLQIPLWKS